MPDLTLLERYAKQRGVTPEVARGQMFGISLAGWRMPLVGLLNSLRPDVLRIDRSFVDDAGRCRSLKEVEHAVEIFRYRSRGDTTWIRNRLGFRASGRRILDLAEEVFSARP
jgi:hypothetical protein